MTAKTALQESAPQATESKVPVLMGDRGLDLSSLDAAWRFAKGVIQGRMAPKGITEPGAVVALMEAGYELGLPPMFALSNLTFINGRLGIMGDAAKALIRSSGKLRAGTGFAVRYEGKGDDKRAIVTSHRFDEVEPVSHEFSVADAKLAKLWEKSGPWTEYPKRMLMYRALGFHVRDQYPEVLMGAGLTEELRDIEPGPKGPKGRTEKEINPPVGKDPLLELAAKSTTVVTDGSGPAQGAPELADGDETEQRVAPPEEPEDAQVVKDMRVATATEAAANLDRHVAEAIEPAGTEPETAPEDAPGEPISTEEAPQEGGESPPPAEEEPPPPGDTDQSPEPQLPLECKHVSPDGKSALINNGDFDVCTQCGYIQEAETIRDAGGRL
jgi:hypothetical protein